MEAEIRVVQVWRSGTDETIQVCRPCLISLMIVGEWLHDTQGMLFNQLHEFCAWGKCDVCTADRIAYRCFVGLALPQDYVI